MLCPEIGQGIACVNAENSQGIRIRRAFSLRLSSFLLDEMELMHLELEYQQENLGQDLDYETELNNRGGRLRSMVLDRSYRLIDSRRSNLNLRPSDDDNLELAWLKLYRSGLDTDSYRILSCVKWEKYGEAKQGAGGFGIEREYCGKDIQVGKWEKGG
ncbi:hypothetical protein Tco_0007803 [Tanacetum coccineum]